MLLYTYFGCCRGNIRTNRDALQLRMSKKIAQLTSVIHQLHTKSEDHEMDLQDMSEAYETEIEQMLRDAASKINTFKNQLEGVRDDTRFKEAVITLEERYRKETEVHICHRSPENDIPTSVNGSKHRRVLISRSLWLK